LLAAEDVRMGLVPLCRLSNRRDIAPNCPLPSPRRAQVEYVLGHPPRAMSQRGSTAGAGGYFHYMRVPPPWVEGMAWVRYWSNAKHATCGRLEEHSAAALVRAGSGHVHIKVQVTQGVSRVRAYRALAHPIARTELCTRHILANSSID
jgi:hypothetical protein